MPEGEPSLPVPASEAWYWRADRQAGEREADELAASGEVAVHAGADAFLAHLDELDSGPTDPPSREPGTASHPPAR